LAALLPWPTGFGALARGGAARAALGGPAGVAILLVASVIVWSLLVWGAAVVVLGAAAHLPGVAGRSALRALLRVVPAALRTTLIAGVGVTVGVGLAGCGSDAAGGTDRSALAAVTEQLADHPAARAAAPAGVAAARVDRSTPSAAGRLALDLDWPILPDLDWPAGRAPADGPAPADPARSAAPKAAGSGSAGAKPVVAAHTATGRTGATARGSVPADAAVTVQPGDTLWSIASDHLPAGADDALIDQTWRAWYAANTAVIGADPNLIQPGQQLRPPTAKDTP
jgi:hypothetical protein